MNQNVLPQLQEIASDLAAEEALVAAQLEEIREKLSGIRSVLPLFGDDASVDTISVVEKAVSEKAVETTKTTRSAKKTTSRPKSTSKASASKTQQKKRKSTAKKKDGRAASWQKYTRPDVKEKTIPEAVRVVLATQPDKSFKIAEVMDALFDDMPKSQYLRARNRISNVLSGGVRDGEWYKGERGTYRLAKA